MCVCLRESARPRQHVTRPTGVAETRLDEDPEAEEAAAANAADSDPTTPTLKGAPDSTNSDAIDGVCCNMFCMQLLVSDAGFSVGCTFPVTHELSQHMFWKKSGTASAA